VKLDFIHETRTNVTKMRYGMLKREKNAELTELLGLEPVSLVIKKGRLRQFGHMDRKDNTD